MEQELNNGLIDILTTVSELQESLLVVPGAEDAMEMLTQMRKTALGAMDMPESFGKAAGYRKESVDRMERLYLLLSEHVGRPLPDSTLFRLCAAADRFSSEVEEYAKARNHAAADRMRGSSDGR